MATTGERRDGESWDHLSGIDWSDVEDKAVRKAPGKGYAGLVGLCLLSLGALMLLVVAGMRFDGVTLWEAYVMPPRAEAAATTRFAGLDFGMSASRATHVLPGMVLAPVTDGEIAGSFEWKGVRHTVAFLDGEHGRKAYRFRSIRVLDRAGERGILDTLTAEYGRPLESGCANPVYAPARLCRHMWMTEGGIAVELASRAVTGADGREWSEVTATFVDLYLEGLKRRPGRA